VKLKLKKIHPIASKRPAAPATQDMLRVYVNAAFWGSTDCSQTAFDSPRSEDLLISTLLAAWAAKKTMTVYVDDTLRPMDAACQATALLVNS
jgi:hypothetical protein